MFCIDTTVLWLLNEPLRYNDGHVTAPYKLSYYVDMFFNARGCRHWSAAGNCGCCGRAGLCSCCCSGCPGTFPKPKFNQQRWILSTNIAIMRVNAITRKPLTIRYAMCIRVSPLSRSPIVHSLSGERTELFSVSAIVHSWRPTSIQLVRDGELLVAHVVSNFVYNYTALSQI